MGDRAIAFRSSDVDRGRLRQILSTYFAYERARTIRGRLIRGSVLVGLLALAATRDTHVAATFSEGIVVLIAVAIAVAVAVEWRIGHSLERQLSDLPAVRIPLQ